MPSAATRLGDVRLGDEAARLDASLASPPMSLLPHARRHLAVGGCATRSRPAGRRPATGATGSRSATCSPGRRRRSRLCSRHGGRPGVPVMVALSARPTSCSTRTPTDPGRTRRDRSDYRWVDDRQTHEGRRASDGAPRLARSWRTCALIPVLESTRSAERPRRGWWRPEPSELPTLIIDDEADQASLNTKVNERTRARPSPRSGRSCCGPEPPVRAVHGDAVWPAPPRAPTTSSARLRRVLHPGPGYTGGREFFVDNADRVVRPIPTWTSSHPRAPDRCCQRASSTPSEASSPGPRCSLATHSSRHRSRCSCTRRTRTTSKLATSSSGAKTPPVATRPRRRTSAGVSQPRSRQERRRLVAAGATDLEDAVPQQVRFALARDDALARQLGERREKVDWQVAPVHVLIGGNKSTGLHGRRPDGDVHEPPTSPQVDTLEHEPRASATGRTSCRTASSSPRRERGGAPRDGVHRVRPSSRAEDLARSGGTVTDGPATSGSCFPPAPSRPAKPCSPHVERFNDGAEWHSLRRPDLRDAPMTPESGARRCGRDSSAARRR